MKNKKNPSKPEKNQKALYIITFLIAIIIISVPFIVGGKQSNQVDSSSVPLEIEGHPVIGDPNAKVVIAEFADFKCPACKTWHDRIFPALMHDYIGPSKAKLVFYNYPVISPDSITAMSFGKSIFKQNPTAFWTFYDETYKHQPDEKLPWATVDNLSRFVKDYVPGIDVEKAKQDAENKVFDAAIGEELRMGEKIGVKSTPTIFVNGKRINNSFDYKEITKAIEEALSTP